MRRFFQFLIRFALPLGALGLHGFIFLCYMRRWDKMAAVTVYPFWAWGLAGLGMALTAWMFTRRRLPLAVAALWLVTIVFCSDETRPVLRSLSAERPQPGAAAPFQGRPVLRVVSFNCKAGYFNPRAAEEVSAWEPDIILFQESARSSALRNLARKLYGGDPAQHVIGGWECSIVTRGRILRNMTGAGPHSVLATIEFPGGLTVEAASVHLQGAETDVRLYKRETLFKHAFNRVSRRGELQRLLDMQTLISGQRPAIIGGDFNAPAGDAIFRLLERAQFTDAMAAAGAGWPNTYPNQAPLLRIDHQWTNARLIPVRACTARSVRSDHRMVICDYLMQ